MDLTAAFNPPRLVQLAGESFWVRGLALEDFALVITWLDDVLPGAHERTAPPLLSSDAARAALASDPGVLVQAWAAMRHLGVKYTDVARLVLAASEEEKLRLATVLFRRRRTMKPHGGGKDLSEMWWGPSVAILVERYHMTPDQVGRLTLDQWDMLAGEGCKEEDPGYLSQTDAAALFEQLPDGTWVPRQHSNGGQPAEVN